MEINNIRKVIAFSKHNSVLLLLLLIFCSCVVSFGMEWQNDENKENKENEDDEKEQQYENKAQESILHAQFIATIPKQVNNTFDQGANHGIEIIDPIDHKDITRLIRFLICMDLIYRDRFINDKDIKSSGYYYPWYLKHHIFTQPFYRGLGGTKQFIS